MKLNNLQKNFYIFFSVIISILITSILWDKINLPLNNTSGAKGVLVLKGYNPANDTIRYIFFIFFPLIVFLFFNQILKDKKIIVSELIHEKNESKPDYNPELVILSFIFIIFIFLEFFSIDYSFLKYELDTTHDGAHLTPAQNYLSNDKFWSSSFLVRGLSDVFYPLLAWKIFDVNSIGATRFSFVFLVFLLKILTVLLSYQLTKITKLNKGNRILFFSVFTSMLISMSKYPFFTWSNDYLSFKDIYIILFLIFFIELFIYSKFRSYNLIAVSLIATFSIFFQIDKGVYIFVILTFYCFYLIAAKNYKDVYLIFLSLAVFWLATIFLVGMEEFKAFLENTKSMILTMDIMHGLKYPEPFFSMGNNSDGARATRGLMLQLIGGLFVINYLFSDTKKIFTSKKVLFIFLFLLSLLMYKNALGRSDAAHIRGSYDLAIIINVFFILNYFLIYFEKKNFFKKIYSYKNSLFISILVLVFYFFSNPNHLRIENIKNYNSNFTNFLNLNDEIFLNESTIKFVKYYNQLPKATHDGDDNCVMHISYNLDMIPYLFKKPSCTKYWSTWLASSTKIQKNFISEIQKIKPKYIIYDPTGNLDGLELYERISLINSYILSNYKKYDEFDNYKILIQK